MRLYARYPYTHFHFGNTESSWIIRDILTDSYQIWKINNWHHICFSFSESNSHISLVKVRYIQEYFFWWYKKIGRCWWIISELCKSLTRKPSYSSFFQLDALILKMYYLIKITEPLPSSLRSRCHFRVLTHFHLEFSLFWISRLFDLGDLSGLKNGSLKYFENGLKSMQIFQRLMGGMNRR